ncbi:MAG: hypothetical protein KL787_01145 [Taibaiella sp.]|nr:hypothetical protein [Taibaiella sp.]
MAGGLWFHDIRLPDNFIDRNIRCLEKDKNGFYWFATVNNLYRHNGFSVDCIYNKNDQPISNISKLLIEGDTLWIASPIGVTRLQLNSWEFKQFSFENFESLINYNREITALVSEPDGSGILVGFKKQSYL